jgi:hypothetical protein
MADLVPSSTTKKWNLQIFKYFYLHLIFDKRFSHTCQCKVKLAKKNFDHIIKFKIFEELPLEVGYFAQPLLIFSSCSFLIFTIDIREYIDWSLAQPPALFWLSCYVTSHCLAVVPQSSAKQRKIFYYVLHNFKFKL